MSRRDKVDVGSALILKPQKDLGQAFHGDDLAGFTQSNLMILAENALQATAGEEDRTGAAIARDTGLLPEMQGCPCSAELGGLTAEACLPRCAVGMASAWA